jgi:hypothetical protein
VLYLERPAKKLGFACSEGALLIQRLEGRRPPGSLCTLNRPEWVQRDHGQAELGAIGLPVVRTERASDFSKPDVGAGEAGIEGVWPDETRHPRARRSTGKD